MPRKPPGASQQNNLKNPDREDFAAFPVFFFAMKRRRAPQPHRKSLRNVPELYDEKVTPINLYCPSIILDYMAEHGERMDVSNSQIVEGIIRGSSRQIDGLDSCDLPMAMDKKRTSVALTPTARNALEAWQRQFRLRSLNQVLVRLLWRWMQASKPSETGA